MKYIRILSRFIIGVVFIFSGFVKAVDPLGSAYKFADYFTAFKLGFLEFLALPMGIFLSAFELVLGITLILGFRRKAIFTVLLYFMSFFTLLTFVLALFNPVSDCGCFGDALILTNWETFFKNLVLMVFVLILYTARNAENPVARPGREWVILGSLMLLASFFSYWNYRHLPLIDFRPYDVGTVIREKMEIPEGVALDEYETKLIYRNIESGKTRSFTMDDYPKDTLQWEFVDSESKLIKKGFEPPIHDFAIMDNYGNDLADAILSDAGYSLIMFAYDLGGAEEAALIGAGEWAQLEVFASDYSFYAVTAATTAEVESVSSALGLGYPFLAADEIMIKTIVRSNPGFVLLKNGTILGKWACRDFPLLQNLDPHWSEVIGNASAPQDEDTRLLMEAGIFEEFSFDIVDFDHFMPDLLLKEGARKKEAAVILVFALGLVLVILLSGLLADFTIFK